MLACTVPRLLTECEPMSLTWRHLPKPARAIAEATVAAVEAARARDAEAYPREVARLAALPSEQAGLVLGGVVRALLEEQYPDGLTADDVRALAVRCLRAAAGWFPAVEPDVVVMLVAGALGLHPSAEEGLPLKAADVAGHAPLLVADLLTTSAAPLNAHLTTAFSTLAVIELSDTP